MADEQNITYPTISTKNWWVLRKKFKNSIPSSLTPANLAIMLGMEERSAKLNVYIQLMKLGIIDKDGKVIAEIANKWREDDHYSDVCKKILHQVYPKELIDLVPGPEINRTDVERWFRLNAGVGESAASKMAGVYQFLLEGDVTKATEDTNSSNKKDNGAKPPKKLTIKANKPVAEKIVQELDTPEKPKNGDENQVKPSIHIDIQIHISPESSPEQIDQIFISMAKHLYPNRNK